ncbi:MAG TPA: DNA recombination protein RmuC [Terracidiphilus sp.]|nr:DNA recombination protein RmuC [Terracidiphilus sp.]
MNVSLILIPLVSVALFGLGLWLGLRQASTKSHEEAEQSLAAERKLAEQRERALKEKIGESATELAQLRPKAEELVRAQEQLKNESAKYEQMKADLDKAFKGAAADALRDNTQSFLALAKQELGGQTQDAKATLDAKEKAIETLLKPLETTLKQLDEQTRQIEAARSGAYGELKSLVEGIGKAVPESLNSLRSETSQLVFALRAPKTRGNWGELQLRRCVEYAGMISHCSFSEQVSTLTEESQRLQPDMTIQLPNGRTIVVDAKTPSDLFSDATSPADPAQLQERLITHASRVKAHLRDLSGKAYWKQFEHTPEFVVCFLPSESLFSAALEGDPGLIEFGANENVVLATPTTLIALLKAVAYGWQQSKITENAKAIQDAGKLLYSKLVKAHEYFEKLGNSLKSTVGHYNSFIGAVEGRQSAFYHARKLGSLVSDGVEMEITEPLEAEPRVLAAEDWTSQISLPLPDESEEVIASE